MSTDLRACRRGHVPPGRQVMLPAAYCTACGLKPGCFIFAPRILDRAAWRYGDTPPSPGAIISPMRRLGCGALVVSCRVTTGRQKSRTRGSALTKALTVICRDVKISFLFFLRHDTLFCVPSPLRHGVLCARRLRFYLFLDRVRGLAFVHGM